MPILKATPSLHFSSLRTGVYSGGGPRNNKRLPACLIILKNATLSHAPCQKLKITIMLKISTTFRVMRPVAVKI
jgi:hypothetical protein